MNELILLKKSYQRLLNDVETFLDNTSEVDENLNDAYLRLVKIASDSKIKIFKAVEEEELTWAELSGYQFYRPFRNLYGAEAEVGGDITERIKKEIIVKMKDYYGDITELCLECEAGDILAEIETQKLFNDIALH